MKYYDSGMALRQKILAGIDVLADNVASTLGPRGRNVILQGSEGAPVITKDGVTVAKFVDLEDPFENAGVQIIKQAAAQTNAMAGDGTTTATVLARAIYKNAQSHIQVGCSPVVLKRQIDEAVEQVVKDLEDLSRPIESEDDILHIATISANNDEKIGKLVALAITSAGKDGSITVEEARSIETSLDLVEGFRFDGGYVSSSFITNERRGAVVYDEPLIMVTDEKIENVKDILPILEQVARESRPFVIVGSDFEGQGLAALIMNAIRGSMRVAAVKAPRYGEERKNILRDLALSVGATFISRENGLRLKDTNLEHLGSCHKIDVLKSGTTIVGGKGDPESVVKKMDALRVELQQTDSMYECERIQDRISRLNSGVAVIRVGAATEVEMIEKRHRIEDALEAVKSAQQEGILAGGGVSLVRASQKLKLKTEGAHIVREAILEPVRQMARNAGDSPDVVVEKICKSKGARGWNFAKGKMMDMLEEGVVDPFKVTRCALQNASSAASTLITTNYAIIKGNK
jgi:chaperonin GroEL